MKKIFDKLKAMRSKVVNGTTEEVMDTVKTTVKKHVNKALPFLIVAVFALAVLTTGSKPGSVIATVAEKGGSIVVNQYGGTLNIH